MKIDLVCGNIGVSANQWRAIDLAHGHGFESVGAHGEEIAQLDAAGLARLKETLQAKNLVFGAAGLPVDFRGEEAAFAEGLQRLETIAAGLQRAGVTRMGTWLSPAHDRLTYLQNFKQHTRRLAAIATILQPHGLRLGLEYVGTPSLRIRRRYGFVHTLTETLELLDAIGTGNTGLVLDSWHWWTARDTAADLAQLKPEQIVAVDLNDAPAGIPIEAQQDNRRELPAATGVIDIKTFLGALQRIGYDGPIRAEPFNRPLNDLDDEEACARTAAAMRKAVGLLQN